MDPKFQIIRNHVALDKAATFFISRPTHIKEKQKKVYVEVVQRTVLCVILNIQLDFHWKILDLCKGLY